MTSYVLLSGGAAFALVCIVLHSLRNHGRRDTLLFLSAAVVYGLLRHWAVWAVTVGFRDASFPYQFVRAPLKVFGISPIELGGWILVAYIGWHLSIQFLRKANLFLISMASFFVIGSVSLAVETTAIAAHWWFWTLALGDGIFGKSRWSA